MVPTLFVGALAVLNVAISWWNCKQVGKSWDMTKAVGGFWRLETWAGAVMAAVGFSWVGMLVSGQALMALDKMSVETYEAIMDLGIFALAVPILFACWTITAGSILRARRERSAINIGLATYNTGATLWNTFVIFRNLGSGAKAAARALSNNNQGKLILFVVTVSIGLGTLVTYLLIKHYVQVTREEERAVASTPTDALVADRPTDGRYSFPLTDQPERSW